MGTIKSDKLVLQANTTLIEIMERNDVILMLTVGLKDSIGHLFF